MEGAASSVFNPMDFGAAGNGRKLDTHAIQQAIDACHDEGGGRVLLPRGKFLTGTLHLKSHVELHLAPNATLLGSAGPHDYDATLAILSAEGVRDVAVTGSGTIDGQGLGPLRAEERAQPRRQTILFKYCRHVRIEGVTLQHSDAWTVHLYRCDHAFVRGVRILNELARSDSAGIVPNCSSNVFISDCHVVAGDDAIAIKSGDAYPCENVVVTNCILRSHGAAIGLGPESRGDIRHIVVGNCVIEDSDEGIGLCLRDGGSFDDLLFHDISIRTRSNCLRPELRDVAREWPVRVRLDRRDVSSALGRIANVSFADIRMRTRGTCWVQGEKDRPIENVSFSNIDFEAAGPLWVDASRGSAGHPGPSAERTRHQVRAYFAIAGARGVVLRDVTIRAAKEEADVAPWALYGVTDAELRGWRVRTQAGGPRPAQGLQEECRDVRDGNG